MKVKHPGRNVAGLYLPSVHTSTKCWRLALQGNHVFLSLNEHQLVEVVDQACESPVHLGLQHPPQTRRSRLAVPIRAEL